MEEKVYFKTVDGLKLCSILSTPEKPTDKCVILCHGITVDKNEDGGFPPLAQILATNNFSAFRFDFRGHGESEGKLVNMTISGEIKDLTSALEFLRTKGYKKFGLVGTSFGAVSSLYCARRKDVIGKNILKARASLGKKII